MFSRSTADNEDTYYSILGAQMEMDFNALKKCAKKA